MKAYVCVPMNNRTEKDILDDFKEVKDKYNYEILNTFFKDEATYTNGIVNDIKPIYLLGKAISLMQEADVVIIKGNIRKSRGCRVEKKVAKLYGKKIIRVK